MSNLTFCSSVDTRNHVCSELLMNDADLKSGSWTEQKDLKRNENIMTERGLPGVDIRQSISFQKGELSTRSLSYNSYGPHDMAHKLYRAITYIGIFIGSGRKILIGLVEKDRF